jgi:choline transport protein
MASLHLDDKAAVATPKPLSSPVFDERISIIPEKYHGTDADRHEMTMLGKKQVLRVMQMQLQHTGEC